jgi:predicted methyltransferase MtxX (methanogen marker protein 4)
MRLIMKNKTYRFEAQSLVRGDIEATDEDEARRIFIEDLEQGELDEELRANVVVSNVGEVKNE